MISTGMAVRPGGLAGPTGRIRLIIRVMIQLEVDAANHPLGDDLSPEADTS